MLFIIILSAQDERTDENDSLIKDRLYQRQYCTLIQITKNEIRWVTTN
jgi:hypothetical protein